jgi:hypothetical protein
MKRIATLFMSVVLLSSVLVAPANARFGVGSACGKVGYKYGNEMICKKVKGKFIWQNFTAADYKSIKFISVCDPDPLTPPEFKKIQDWMRSRTHCEHPIRFVDLKLPDTKPKSVLSAVGTNLEPCKLKPTTPYETVGFRPFSWNFGGDIQLQVIPMQFSDYPTTNKPIDDYGHYFKYLKEMFYKISDGNTRINFIVPDKYFELGKPLSYYAIPGEKETTNFTWNKMDINKYKSDYYRVADQNLDFTGIVMAVQVLPLNTNPDYIPHSANFRMDEMRTNEGTVRFNYIWPVPSLGEIKSVMGVDPWLHLHEFMHANGILTDHIGDQAGRTGPNLGSGNWGHMSGMLTDFLVWDKWLAKMIKESQVSCTDPNATTTHWIRPNEAFGDFLKMVVVPVSATKAIAIESHRAGGANYKFTKESEGALVYLVDTEDTRPESGIHVVRPLNRKTSVNSGPFVLSDAPLKLNESLTLQGYKITVVEAGAFGDVVKVEKV